MGFFNSAKAQIIGQKAYRAHVAANQLVTDGKPKEAEAKYREVRRMYEEAISGAPQPPNVPLGYAILLMRQGEFDRAMEIMQKLRTDKNLKEADWFDIRINYSVCLWRKGRLEEAIATAKRAGQIKKCSVYYSTLGMYLAEQAAITGDFAEVEAFNAEAMDYDDEDAGALDNMGMMYEAKSKFAADPAPDRQKAKEYFEKAHAAKPRQITTMYALARMYHEDGQDDLARKALGNAENLYFSAVCSVSEDMMEGLKRELGMSR